MDTTSPLTPAGHHSLANLFHFPALLFSLQTIRWREATAAAVHINQIIANEKSLRDIMLSTGSLFISPPSH